MLGNHIYVESPMFAAHRGLGPVLSTLGRPTLPATFPWSRGVGGTSLLPGDNGDLVSSLHRSCPPREPRLQTLPGASAPTAHRTAPPISPSKRKFSVTLATTT